MDDFNGYALLSESFISSDAASKALALLLDDFRLSRKTDSGDTQMIDESTPGELEKKTRELEMVLSGFTQHVHGVIARIRRQENTLVPIHRLSTEILQYIFHLCASETFLVRVDDSVVHEENLEYHIAKDDRYEISSPNHHQPKYMVAIHLSSVSSHWYQLATAHSQLWSYLDSRLSLETTELFLRRSKQAHLFITCPENVDRNHELMFMNLIAPHVHRWKAFNAYSYGSALLKNIGAETAPSLELFVAHRSAGLKRGSDLPWLILIGSPGLRQLHIDSFRLSELAYISTRLTKLGIDATLFIQMGRAYDRFFTRFPLLETLFISGHKAKVLQFPTFSAKVPNLRSLYLCDLDCEEAAGLLFSLFPNPLKLPLVKILGYFTPEVTKEAFSDPTRAGSLMDLICHTMTWLSTSDFVSSKHHGVIRMGVDYEGIQSTLLEIVADSDHLGITILSLLLPNTTLMLRRLSLRSRDFIPFDLLPNLHCCPHLEQLIVTGSTDGDWWNDVVQLLRGLAFPPINDISVEPAAANPGLKYLSLRGIGQRSGVIEVLNARDEVSKAQLLDSKLLRQLGKLDVQHGLYEVTESDELISKEISATLTVRGVSFEVLHR